MNSSHAFLLTSNQQAAQDRRLLGWLVVAVALIAHLGIGSGFVGSYAPLNYDDPQVMHAAQNRSVTELLTETTWYAYKPLYFLSLKVDALFGDSMSQAAHVHNLLLHALAAWLLFQLLLGVLPTAAAAGAALLFGAHPVHAESIAWISGRKDVLSLVLVLVAHWVYRRDRALGRLWLWRPALWLLLAGLTKGTVWTWAGLLCLDEVFWTRSGEPSRGAAWRRLAPVLCVALGGIALDFWIGATAGPGGVEHGVGTSELMAAMAGVHARYLGTLLWPAALSLDYSVDPAGQWSSPLALLGLGLALAAVGLLLVSLRRGWRVPALVSGFWILGLAPVNNLLPRTASLMADRYLYIPAIGIYVAVAVWAAGSPRLRLGVLGLLVAALMVASNVRTGAFASSERVWTDAIETVPHSALARLQRGHAHATVRHYDAALADAEVALALHPRPELLVRARLLRCAALLGLARTDELLDEANLAVQLARALRDDEMVRDDPSAVHAQAEIFRGQALEARGDASTALLAYRHAVALDKSNFTAHFNYGTLLATQRGEETLGDAVFHLREAWRLNPEFLEGALQLATVLARRSDGAGARDVLAKAERRHGRSPDLVYALATVALEVDRDWNSARDLLRELQERDAHHPKGSRLQADIYMSVGRARLNEGRDKGDVRLLTEAVHHFDLALGVQDSRWEAHVFAGDAFAERGRYSQARGRYRQALDKAAPQVWIASLIGRTAALETALLAREAGTDGERFAAAQVLARALGPPLRRLDLGFAPLEDELGLLRPVAALLDAQDSIVRHHATGVLLATSLLVTGDEVGALQELRLVMAQVPSDEAHAAILSAALLLKAMVQERQTELDGARADYSALAARRPQDVLPGLRRAQIDLRAALARRTIAEGHREDLENLERVQREVELAAERAEAVADAQPQSVSAGLLAVEADIHRQRWIEALRRLNVLVERFPDAPSVYRGFNAVYVAQYTSTREPRLIEEASLALKRALDLDPRDVRTSMDAARLALLANDLNSAIKHAERARAMESYGGGPASRLLCDLHVELGKKALDGGQLELGRQAIDAARRADPTRAGSWVLEGDWLLKGSARDRHERAMELAYKAKELEPLNPTVNAFLARCHRIRGVQCMVRMAAVVAPREGDAKVAWDALTQEERAERLTQAKAQWRAEAVRAFEASVKLDPGGEETRDTQVRIDSLRSSDPQAQWERSQKASEAFVAGRVHLENGELVPALRDLRTAVDLYPDYARAHYHVVEVVYRLLVTLRGDDPQETKSARQERMDLANRYLESGFYSLHQLDALDSSGEFAERWYFRGLFNDWIYRAQGFEEARAAARKAFEHFLLMKRAAGDDENPGLAVARHKLNYLRKEKEEGR